MQQYLNLLQDVLDNGIGKDDRTGTGALSVFGRQARFDLSQSFPLLTTKKLHWKSIVHELIWFLRGDTNIKYLNERGVRIWDEWADADGNLGPVYGAQWRRWGESASPLSDEARIKNHGETAGKPKIAATDQIATVIESIRTNPDSRRHIVSAWNVPQIAEMKLPPCHVMFQFYVSQGTLSCQLYQRSADIFLGVPFNIASYALLTLMVAQVCGLRAGEFVHTFGDLHLYVNHVEQAKTQLARQPLAPPRVKVHPRAEMDDFVFEDFELLDYEAHPHIAAPVAV